MCFHIRFALGPAPVPVVAALAGKKPVARVVVCGMAVEIETARLTSARHGHTYYILLRQLRTIS